MLQKCYLYYWKHEFFNQDIRAYGLTEDHKTVCVIIDDFEPFVQLRLEHTYNFNNNVTFFNVKVFLKREGLLFN